MRPRYLAIGVAALIGFAGAPALSQSAGTVGSGGSAAAGSTSATTLGTGGTSSGSSGTGSSLATGGSGAAADGKADSRSHVNETGQGGLHGQSKAMGHEPGGEWSKSQTQTKVQGDDLSSRTKSMSHEPGGPPAKSTTTTNVPLSGSTTGR
jgi:hypothetical protein